MQHSRVQTAPSRPIQPTSRLGCQVPHRPPARLLAGLHLIISTWYQNHTGGQLSVFATSTATALRDSYWKRPSVSQHNFVMFFLQDNNVHARCCFAWVNASYPTSAAGSLRAFTGSVRWHWSCCLLLWLTHTLTHSRAALLSSRVTWWTYET